MDQKRPVNLGDATALDLQLSGPCFQKLGGGEDGAFARRSDLGKAFLLGAEAWVALLRQRPCVDEPGIEALVDGFVEGGADTEVDERPCRGQDDGHRDREGERQASPDRQAAHASRSR
jgi:hypothetical protein